MMKFSVSSVENDMPDLKCQPYSYAGTCFQWDLAHEATYGYLSKPLFQESFPIRRQNFAWHLKVSRTFLKAREEFVLHHEDSTVPWADRHRLEITLGLSVA